MPEILTRLKCSLAISTYQAGKLVLISAVDDSKIVQLPRTFEKPMGIAKSADGRKMALACKDEVVVFKNSPELATHYPAAQNKYDALFMPRATYYTGALDAHDLHYGADGTLYGINTSFSCLMKISEEYSFEPIWKPGFIDELVSEDRCHLNGLAMADGKPKYATAFGKGNKAQIWRENVTSGGIIIDIETDEIIAENLAMPHTPRVYDGSLYTLLSATGELIKVNTQDGTYEAVTKLDGFVRGMDLHKGYLFIGLSKLRKNSSTFSKLNLKADEAAIVIVHLDTGSVAGKITYQSSLDEIYDIQVLPDILRPNIMNTLKKDYKMGLSTPTATYWASSEPNTKV